MSWQYLHLLWLCFSTFLFCLSRGCFFSLLRRSTAEWKWAVWVWNMPLWEKVHHWRNSVDLPLLVAFLLFLQTRVCHYASSFRSGTRPAQENSKNELETDRPGWRFSPLSKLHIPVSRQIFFAVIWRCSFHARTTDYLFCFRLVFFFFLPPLPFLPSPLRVSCHWPVCYT